MSNIVGASRTIVIRASWDTLSLVAAASAVTFAMSYVVHSKHDRTPSATEARAQAPLQDWAGHLAELVPPTAAAPSEPMSSAALVVPRSRLALPAVVAKLPVKRPCLEASCSKEPATTAASAATVVAAKAERAREKPKGTLLGLLNPLNHLPDMTEVRRPFSYAGGTVAGWFRRL